MFIYALISSFILTFYFYSLLSVSQLSKVIPGSDSYSLLWLELTQLVTKHHAGMGRRKYDESLEGPGEGQGGLTHQ